MRCCRIAIKNQVLRRTWRGRKPLKESIVNSICLVGTMNRRKRIVKRPFHNDKTAMRTQNKGICIVFCWVRLVRLCICQIKTKSYCDKCKKHKNVSTFQSLYSAIGFSIKNLSQSIAALQPLPAATIAWRYEGSMTSPAANTPSMFVLLLLSKVLM